MTTNIHHMPYGAEVTDAGTRFCLWAPGASEVSLILNPGTNERAIDLTKDDAGWRSATLGDVGAGARYGYRIDNGLVVPDPASRCQPDDVHASSLVVDPNSYLWQHDDWRGRPWEDTVLYELHVGTFSSEGTFDGVRSHLDHFVDLGVTAIELMPIADFCGKRNWGYDGVLPFAPDAAYGTPDELKRLVDAAHSRGLMVFLDVVYNHFGPEGNYLHAYAPQFFTDDIQTPWGAGIDFARREVRDFFIHNVLYWLEEFRFDGLRFDAVHAIVDKTSPNILEEIADRVHAHFGDDRHFHLVLENEDNTARYLERGRDGKPMRYVAQWNDDIHHGFHVLATGESVSYYEDYADRPVDHLLRCLTEGFAYQGEPFRHRDGDPRGEPSAHLPLSAFVSFMQNHDQVGNRAFGDRISVLAEPNVVKALAAIMLLAPSPPILFMGEEWGTTEPFLFFCDFHDELADNVREGRRREFAQFPEFRNPADRERIPDPNAETTFERSKLKWEQLSQSPYSEHLDHYRRLLALRREHVIDRLAGMQGQSATTDRRSETSFIVQWRLGDGSQLTLVANLGVDAGPSLAHWPQGRLILATDQKIAEAMANQQLPPWFVAWFVEPK